jgi:bacteriorhodopsin
LWTAYPIVFALAEGTNKITVDAEIIAYGVLDVAAKLGFTYMLLLVHTHGEDAIEFPEWFTEPRLGESSDGRTGYGAIRVGED